MANHYLQTVFTIPVTPDEAALLQECFAVSGQLANDLAEMPADHLDAMAACYSSRSEAFRLAFPQREDLENPFATFLDLWPDFAMPEFGVDLAINTDSDGKSLTARMSGQEAEVHALASLIQKVCRSALPFGFQWAQICDKDLPGVFGGGYYVVTQSDLVGGPTIWLMQETLQALRAGART